jgi:hypothetical protein
MSFNWLDIALIGTIATVAGIQFLRSTRDFSRVLYETIFMIAAVAAAAMLLRPLRAMTDFSPSLLFGAVGAFLTMLGIVLAALINRRMSFGLGVFDYFFGLLLAIACGYALGHLALRTADLALSPRYPEFVDAIRRSWVTRDLLYFKTFIEVRAFLRFARWRGF